MAGKKALVIGVDGGTWVALKPYINQGVMPGLGRILEESAHGVLKSVIPPITAPAWVSFATGVNPGRHGCFNFVNMRSFGDFRPINASDIKVETVYETLSGNGYRCTLVNLPVSYPPRIEKTLITGLMSMGDDFIYPPELRGEIPLLKEYKIIPEGLAGRVHSEFPRDSDLIIENEAVRFEVARELFDREWDFFFVLFSGADNIEHKVFAEMLIGEGPKAEGAREYFAKLDGWVTWFFDNAGPETLKIIMSDHGFRVCRGTLAVNAWLEESGYLEFVPGEDFSRMRSTVQKKAMGQEKQLKSSVARVRDVVKGNRFTARLVPFFRRTAERSDILRGLVSGDLRPDYENSKAVCFFPGIYVREDMAGRERTISDLLDGLEVLNREYHLFSRACRREEIYWGPYIPLAPDIMLIDPNFRLFSGRRKKLFEASPIPWHDKDGIWVLSGPDGVAGKEFAASIMDICPTIIEWMSVEPPHPYDGKSILRRLEE